MKQPFDWQTLRLTTMEHPLITLAKLAEQNYLEGRTITLEEYAAKNGIDLNELEEAEEEWGRQQSARWPERPLPMPASTRSWASLYRFGMKAWIADVLLQLL